MEEAISRSSSSIDEVKSEASTECRSWSVLCSLASAETKRMISVPIVCINAVAASLILVPCWSSLCKVCAMFAAGMRESRSRVSLLELASGFDVGLAMGYDLSIVRVGMQVEERRRVPMPWHWIGKMNCGGRSSAMERIKEAGTPNLVGQAVAREHASSMQQAVTYKGSLCRHDDREDPRALGLGAQSSVREKSSPKAPVGAGYCPQRLIIASRAQS